MKNSFTPLLQALSEGVNIPLDKPIVLIGCHQECDIQIPSRKISRRHCCLAQIGDHLVVRDLGSTNGVRINGVKVLEGNLQPGDELMIGNIRYQLKWGAEANPTGISSKKQGSRAKTVAKAGSDDSGELPVALPDVSLSQPIPQGKPIVPVAQNKAEMGQIHGNGDGAHEPASLRIPESIQLLPLDPP